MFKKPKKVNCDDCSKSFKIKLEVKKLEDGIEKTFFICPKCKKEYLVMYTSQESRELQKRIEKLKEELKKNQLIVQNQVKKGNNNPDLSKVNSTWNEIQGLIKIHKKVVGDLILQMG